MHTCGYPATQQASFFDRKARTNLHDMRYIDHRVLGKARDTEEMVYWVSVTVDESRRPVSWHAAVELIRKLGASIPHYGHTVSTFSTVSLEHRYHQVSFLYFLHMLPHTLHNTIMINHRINKIQELH